MEGQGLILLESTLPPKLLSLEFLARQGILHAGAVLDPGVIINIALSSIRNEFGGKVEGARQMAAKTCSLPLSAFNLFSSLASFSGSGGQAGYAAANGVLDSMAQSMQVGMPL